MAIVNVTSNIYNGTETNNGKLELQGELSDERPVLKPENSGSSFYNVDTKEGFVWHVNRWCPT